MLLDCFVFIQVIYALNTKNDESEVIIANIKEQYEDRLQSTLTDTRNKIEHYRYFHPLEFYNYCELSFKHELSGLKSKTQYLLKYTYVIGLCSLCS